MNHIPKKLNDELNIDPFYKQCCLRADGMCEGRVERHHNLIFGGKQVQAKFCILPACSEYHHKFANRKDIRDRLNWVMLNRASDEEIAMYSKAISYKLERDRLNSVFGQFMS